MMGLDVYIDAIIKEKATGRIISYNPAYPSEKSITIFYFDGWNAAPVLHSWIEIINRYGGTHYTRHDNSMPFPQTALREMCSCLLSYCCVPEENRYQWNLETGFWESNEREQRRGIPYSSDQQFSHIDYDEYYYTENTFLTLARVLREIIWMLDQIHYENKFDPLSEYRGLPEDYKWVFEKWTFPDDFIELPDDLRKFKENPNAYTWEFELINSQ
nr:MAG TPA: hypothetical protein [Caudoviricetes sp.]